MQHGRIIVEDTSLPKINLFDQTLKIIARNYAATFLRLAFPDKPIHLLGTVENVELVLPIRPVDFVHRVAHENQEYILHLEFQLEHEPSFPRRMGLYHNLLAEQFNLPVLSLALYLKPRKATIPNEYLVQLGEQTINRFAYPVLRLWDYVDDIRAGKFRELAPFLVMLVDKADTTVLHAERDLILAETEQKKRVELLSLAVPIAARYFDKNFLWRFFREELDMLKGTSFIDDWIQEGVEKGLQEGLQEGRLQEGREFVLETIRERFDPTVRQLEKLSRQLDKIKNRATLKALFNHALHDTKLEDFLARLD